MTLGKVPNKSRHLHDSWMAEKFSVHLNWIKTTCLCVERSYSLGSDSHTEGSNERNEQRDLWKFWGLGTVPECVADP